MRSVLKKTRGFSLIEMVIYISILSLITFVVVEISVSFSRTYRDMRVVRAIDSSAVIAMERMVRDIRNARTVAIAQSSLGVNPGVLTLQSSATTTRFYVDQGLLKVDVNGVYSGPLSLVKTSVTNFVLHRLASTTQAIKVDLTLQSTSGSVTKSKTYHTTVVLKGL